MARSRTLDEHNQRTPMRASASLNLIANLFGELTDDRILSRYRILKTTAVFTDLTQVNGTSFSDIDTRLSEVASHFQTYLTDIQAHLQLIVLKKTEAREDFTVSALSLPLLVWQCSPEKMISMGLQTGHRRLRPVCNVLSGVKKVMTPL
jgi:hypothetical protein